MVGRKLAATNEIQVFYREEILSKEKHLEEWKAWFVHGIKVVSISILFVSIRLYVRTLNTFKKLYANAKIFVKKTYRKRTELEKLEKQEASKFLKMISDYKRKIRKIKQQVAEEEKANTSE